MLKIRKITNLQCLSNKRYFGSSAENYQNNLAFLFQKHTKDLKMPYFTTRSGNIEILKDPIDFYVALHQGIRSSHERIVLSSLYVGTGNLEKFLVSSLDSKIKRSKKIRINMLFDLQRGTRLNSDGESSRTLLTPLKMDNRHNPHLNIAFFKNPNMNRIISVLGQSGFREIFGTHHMKIYIFDNNVLISGANLHESYFTERQDRYILFKNVQELANFLEDMVQVISNSSYQIEDNGDLTVPNNQPRPENSKELTKALLHQFKMFLFSNKIDIKDKKFEEVFGLHEDHDYQSVFTVNVKEGSLKENKKETEAQTISSEKETQDNLESQPNTEQKIDSKFFKEDKDTVKNLNENKEKAKARLQRSFDEYDVSQIVTKIESNVTKTKEQSDLMEMGGVVYLFPFVQFPPLNYDEDRKFFEEFLDRNCKNEKNHIKFSLGYMNLIPRMVDIVSRSQAKVDLLTCSPMANGFFGGGFFKKWIPKFYRAYEYVLLKRLGKLNNDRVSIHEYTRGQWTFHSKGLWVYENNEQHPSFSSIGSSNFSHRAYFRDTEMNLYFYSQCPKFKEELHIENLRQYQYSENVTKRDLRKDPILKFGWPTVWLSKIFSSFL